MSNKKKALIWIGAIVIVGGIIVLGFNSSGGNNTANVANTVNAPQTPVQQSVASPSLSNNNYYINSSGNTVHSPAYSNSVPAGATAQCRDGTYSFSQHRRGTCSYHGGVAQWL